MTGLSVPGGGTYSGDFSRVGAVSTRGAGRPCVCLCCERERERERGRERERRGDAVSVREAGRPCVCPCHVYILTLYTYKQNLPPRPWLWRALPRQWHWPKYMHVVYTYVHIRIQIHSLPPRPWLWRALPRQWRWSKLQTAFHPWLVRMPPPAIMYVCMYGEDASTCAFSQEHSCTYIHT
jgi:hypothetical protein